MTKKKRVMYSSEVVFRAIAYAMDNSRQRAQKNADDYIRLNPQDKERRQRVLASCGKLTEDEKNDDYVKYAMQKGSETNG